MRALFTGSGWRPFVDFLARHLPAGIQVSIWDRARPLEEAVAEVEFLLPSNAPFSAPVIAAARAARLIQQPAAGVENIDLAAARARGIPVANAPGANQRAVAESALLLMLGLARRLPEARARFAGAVIGEPIGRELGGRRLGVVGTGRTGSALAGLARGIGMEVIAIGSRRSDAGWADFLAAADVVSLHCPLTDATRGLIDDRAFALMKPGALLINCARGPVVDRGALERALAGDRLGGVGLDVFWREPWDPSDPLFAHPRVLVLPHIAGSTEEAFDQIARVCAENILRVSRGEEPLHRVA
ncbi:MAG TPA: 2-hydroxyacid dehydrogenase [Kofleriaceae bacterium]|nr:2-hydroxyacid dehydrogenase [Kofleriaceae bacterium]